jgi:hypothetical protein
MAVYVDTFFEDRVEQLFSLADTVERIFASAGLDYRIVGGLATYPYREAAEPDSGRLTRDIDVVVRRADLPCIAKAAEAFGFEHRHVAGLEMLTRAGQPSARRAVDLVFAGETVRPDDPEAVPDIGQPEKRRGLRLIPLPELVRMKLTSFRAIDEAHVKDLDELGRITRKSNGD